MRNPNFPHQLHRFVEIPSTGGQPPAHNLIDTIPNNRDESVEAKWEQIQYYESKENHSLNSLASSTATNSSSSTTSASSSSTNSNAKLKSRLQKLKKNGLKKLANFKLWTTSRNESTTESGQQQASPPPPVNSEVSTAPNGLSISKMRAAKSMQNLEQLTRDSFYNLKDISNNLKQKYSSRMELRQQSQMYNELWDDEDEEEEHQQDFYHHHRYDY